MSPPSVSVEELLDREELHIFGYGSLIWRPGFEYDSMQLGYINGYERRFWQGSTHHRGTEENPGRVLTALPKESGRIYGITYTVSGRERMKFALEALGVRESLLAGYSCMMMDFFAVQSSRSAKHSFSSEDADHASCGSPGSEVLLYIALPDNPLYAGHMPEERIGHLVSGTEGVCGPNSDYITKLADFMSQYFPHVDEPHLYSVDYFVRKYDQEKSQRSGGGGKPERKVSVRWNAAHRVNHLVGQSASNSPSLVSPLKV